MNAAQVGDVVAGVLARFDLELEAVEIAPSGRRSRVRVVVDGDGPDGHGPGLDDLAEATRAVSTALDDSPAVGDAPYTLEVTTRGVSRPLTAAKHWRRNRGRLVRVELADGRSLTGRIDGLSADETAVGLTVQHERARSGRATARGTESTTETLALADIAAAVVQVEFNRPKGAGPGKEVELDLDGPADPEPLDQAPGGEEED